MGAREHDAMVEIEVEDGLAQEERAKRLTLKRRGLIAGAAVLAAGVLAKQASAPENVAAADGDPVLIGQLNSSTGNGTTMVAAAGATYSSSILSLISFEPSKNIPGLSAVASGNASGVDGSSGPGGGFGVIGRGVGANTDGVRGIGTGNNAGVSGIAGNNGGSGVVGFAGAQGTAPAIGAGVVGTTFGFVPGPGQNAGVLGQTNVAGAPGVYGHATVGNTNGVTGSGANGGAGVFGINSNSAGIGVQGFNDHGPAVQGNTSEGIGVKGIATSGTGVYGITTGLYGVRGDGGTAAGSAGLLGVATDSHAVAFGSVVVAPATIAGYFNGEVHVEGPFYVDPISNKHGVIAHPDGTKRVFYSMEAPESWVEDFGRGTLAGGKAEVRLDPDFAAVVHTDDYHVFLTSHDAANKGVAVTAHKADGFTVQEQQGGTSSGTFSWRVVAKPNVGQKVARMPKYEKKLDSEQFKKQALATAAHPKKP